MAHRRPWDESYRREEPPPWDAGGPRAAVVRLCEEDALEIASRGIEVVGVDVAPTAIRRAQEKASARGVTATFLVGDALRLDRLGRTFASVLDSGLFHTFDDDERRDYVESLAAVTAPGSVLNLLCVNDTAPGDIGPRRISQAELREAFRDGWTVASIEADHLEVTWDPVGLPAWRARIERA